MISFTNFKLELYVFFSTRHTLITFNQWVVHLNVYSDNQKVALIVTKCCYVGTNIISQCLLNFSKNDSLTHFHPKVQNGGASDVPGERRLGTLSGQTVLLLCPATGKNILTSSKACGSLYVLSDRQRETTFQSEQTG